MRPVSDAFLRTVTGSHVMVARATVCKTFQTGTAPVGTRIPIFDGNVIVDGTAEVRSTLDLTTDGTSMWPTRASDPLAPYGNEIYVERGIAYSDVEIEWVGLGYFRIDAPEQAEAPDGPIQLTGSDRMAGIVDARLVEPRQFLAGATLGTVVSTLVTEVYPAATIEWDDATDTVLLARTVVVGNDAEEGSRFGFLDELITAQGKIWHWDHRGVLVIKSPPDPTRPVVEVSAGRGGVLLTLSRTLSRAGVYNAVVASGEGLDNLSSARAVAIDANPASPTYYYGRFGPVPRFFTSSFITTTSQAQAAGAAMLRRALGLPYSANLKAVPNPALEPFDPVLVRYSDRSAPETHVLDSLTIPLVPAEALTAATREQTVILIGSA